MARSFGELRYLLGGKTSKTYLYMMATVILDLGSMTGVSKGLLDFRVIVPQL